MKGFLKRMAAVLLAIAVIFTFTPFMDAQTAYAADKTPIATVALTCPVPSAGASIPATASTSTSQYSCTTEWFYNDGSSNEWQAASGTYQRGLDYLVRFTVSPKSGYTVYDSPNLVVSVNGDTNVEKSFMALGNTEYMFVGYLYHIDGTIYSVTFDANGGSGSMTGFRAEENNYCELPGCSFTAPAEMRFDGWLVNGQTKQPGDKIKITGNTVVKAKWNAIPKYTVTFETYGIGVKPADQLVLENGYASEPPMEDDGDWHFAGWYKDPELTELWEFSYHKVTRDTTIYAAWGRPLTRIFLYTDVPAVGDSFTNGKSGTGDGFTYSMDWSYDDRGEQLAASPFESGWDYYAVFTVTPRPGFSIDIFNVMALVNDDNHVTMRADSYDDSLQVSYRYHFLTENDITIPEEDLIYNGSAFEPKPVVMAGNTPLSEHFNYDLSYENNVNAGTATVTITGKGGYLGAVTKEFEIQPKSLKGAAVSGSVSKTYTGKELTQNPKVVLDGATLIKNTDYTLSYKNNTNAGTATMVIQGKGNYTGSLTKNFKINPAAITSATLKTASYTWNGQPKKPGATVKAKVNGTTKTLTAGTDYTISYKYNTNVGKATATIKGKGNYTGTISKTFKINPKGTTISSVSAASKGFTVKWAKQATQTTGYQIYYTTSTTAPKATTTPKATISSTSTVSKKVTGLKGGKKYYVYVRTYKTVNGVKYYSKWSAKKYVTTKK